MTYPSPSTSQVATAVPLMKRISQAGSIIVIGIGNPYRNAGRYAPKLSKSYEVVNFLSKT
jgi:hypothetical protein